MRQRNRPTRARTRVAHTVLALALAGSIVATIPGIATAVPPPPPNPSDSELQQADSRVDQTLRRIGDLINDVASANAQLAEIAAQVAIKREDVNKALVDLQSSRDVAVAATAAVAAARTDMGVAGQAIEVAQQQFDDFVAASYRQGSTAGSLTVFLGTDSPDDLLAKADLVRMITKKHNAVMDELQRARTTRSNTESVARAAQATADAAAARAEDNKALATEAIQRVTDVQKSATDQQAVVMKERDSAQSELDAARNSATGLQNQRQVYDQWDTQRRADEAATAAAIAAAQQAAAEAATRVAADQIARDRAADIASRQRPHTQINDGPSETKVPSATAPPPTPSPTKAPPPPPSVTTPPSTASPTKAPPAATTDPGDGEGGNGQNSATDEGAIETVIDRAMSQLGVRYSWGGGDANGPTFGIRDGGVADTFGDFENAGFDCSGIMIYAFAGVGISLPHYSGYQYTAGRQVPASQMKRGDLIFYGPNASQHEALYLGNNQMLESPQSGDVVKVSPVRWDGMVPNVTRLL
ncbi:MULTISPECIES: NlpC/P60 family protein [Rhodococcus]|uniref:NlpC/P60 family protein n=1 Tax=Rhodococcus TaxID=1827 RepID=UPI0007DB2403|nr:MULTISPECIES: NlpC/P60 family protein [Rhodococcus]ORI15174.1 invasin [Rhodococcus erythropolis]BDQ23646.1 C40 family peptidase [Rhodococcus qingshengii]